MQDPREIYTVDESIAAEVALGAERAGLGPTMLHMVRGFVDAGSAGQVGAEHLLERFTPRRLVTFDVDALLDYRARRPAMTFDATAWVDYAEPELAIDVLTDGEGVDLLLLHGTEPDVQWERWVAAVRQVVERFDVPLLVGVHGIPMGVPHTRPLGVTAHGTRPELVADHRSWFGTVQVPASVGALLEYRLGRWGHDALGFAVHVPHYLAQSPYPQAARTALEHVERVTGLVLSPDALADAAQEALEEVTRQVSESEEVAAVVRALEEQYDAFARAAGRSSLLAEPEDLPTAEELGAEFERFLARQRPDGS
ncbi:PAC2 family protein [Cellulomonas sp. APG4]|uniref:proteasome assembly chaperone family protein n=1 Tax=Cellulomonas sp. APG4 TaxID=1538656 RepID=UPI001379B3FC|nr:PAC2 family protein [Cellulomonas sp. APG4]NCT92070.1 PAC2 family protein [Cellulomonas sp. APG4]